MALPISKELRISFVYLLDIFVIIISHASVKNAFKIQFNHFYLSSKLKHFQRARLTQINELCIAYARVPIDIGAYVHVNYNHARAIFFTIQLGLRLMICERAQVV